MQHLPSRGAARPVRRDADAAADTLWRIFAHPNSQAEFHAVWLALVCAQVPGARVGLLLAENDGSFAPAAIWPDTLRDATHLGAVAERAIRAREGVVQSGAMPDKGVGTTEIAYPIDDGTRTTAVVVVETDSAPPAELRDILRHLHWSAAWLERDALADRAATAADRAKRIAVALDVAAAAAECDGFDAYLMALANEVAARFDAHRAAIGLVRRGRVRIVALSQAPTFDRRSALADAIETAMEEAAHIGRCVVWPATAGGPVSVGHHHLCEELGGLSAVSVPMVAQGRQVGVLTVERGPDAAVFDDAAVELLELCAGLVAPQIEIRRSEHRWFAGRVAKRVRSGIVALFGPRHVLAKLATLSALVTVAVLVLVSGPFRIGAKASLEGTVLRAAVAPFEGYVLDAPVRAGDVVRADDVLATLDDRDLRFERLKWTSERAKLEQRQREAMAKFDRVGIGVVEAQLAQAAAELALAEEKLARTKIRAAISGVVVSGDLTQLLGTPVEAGKVLFEIAPLDAYRVALLVADEDIAFVALGQRGTLALTGASGREIPFAVTRITSVSKPQDGHNLFRVEAELQSSVDTLRPGMEGVGKIEVGTERLAWVWTRTVVNRVRSFVWTWTP